jgi:hypothetical protein
VPLEVRATSSTGQVQVVGSDNTNATWRLATPSASVVAFGGATTHSVAFGGFAATTEAFTERARIDSSGRLLVGTSTSVGASGLSTPQVQFSQNGASSESITSLTTWCGTSTGFASQLHFRRSYSDTLGTHTVVVDGARLGTIRFTGSDGTDFKQAATISAEVDGTPGTNDMPGRLVFSTTADGASSPTERMRITQAGDLNYGTGGGIVDPGTGTTDGLYYNNTDKQFVLSRNGGGSLILRRRISDGTIQGFYRDTTLVGTISVTASATAYNTSSDYRLKENVVPLTGAADRVNQLQVHRFNFIADPDKTVDGFLAHEAQAVVPECVTGTKDEVDADGNPVYQGIDQSKLVPLLTAALQEALARIETLEAEVQQLKGQ